MRKLIIFIFLLASYSSFGQTKEELRAIFAFFLGQGDSLQVYKKIVLQADSSIAVKNETIKADSAFMKVQQSDINEYVHVIMGKNTQLDNKDKEIDLVKDQSKEDKKTLIKWIVGLGAGDVVMIVLFILLL